MHRTCPGYCPCEYSSWTHQLQSVTLLPVMIPYIHTHMHTHTRTHTHTALSRGPALPIASTPSHHLTRGESDLPYKLIPQGCPNSPKVLGALFFLMWVETHPPRKESWSSVSQGGNQTSLLPGAYSSSCRYCLVHFAVSRM